MAEPLIRRFEEVLGPLESADLPAEVRQQAEALKAKFLSDEWLYKKGQRRPGRDVKIARGVNVVQRVHKAPGGLLPATLEVKGDRLVSVSLSGDFFCYPEDGVSDLESALEGTSVDQVGDAVAAFYASGEVETPGVTPADWLKVLLP
jgi:lipoate-protein ligase A